MSVVLIMFWGEVMAMIDWVRVREDVLHSLSLGNLLIGGECFSLSDSSWNLVFSGDLSQRWNVNFHLNELGVGVLIWSVRSFVNIDRFLDWNGNCNWFLDISEISFSLNDGERNLLGDSLWNLVVDEMVLSNWDFECFSLVDGLSDSSWNFVSFLLVDGLWNLNFINICLLGGHLVWFLLIDSSGHALINRIWNRFIDGSCHLFWFSVNFLNGDGVWLLIGVSFLNWDLVFLFSVGFSSDLLGDRIWLKHGESLTVLLIYDLLHFLIFDVSLFVDVYIFG